MKNKKLTKKEAQQAVEKLLKEIRDIVNSGNYIFRGESRKDHELEDGEIDKNPPVASNLYRQHKRAAKMEHFKIEDVQDQILEDAEKHVKGHSKDELLEQIQHYGGKTNQIDFTTDCLIALFFACEGENDKDGRLIFLSVDKFNQGTLYEPQNPKNRVIAQKSIFVRPPSGVVNPDKIIPVDSKLKLHMIDYLNKHHNINVGSVYNDIHGFIDRNKNYQNAYTNFFLGLAYEQEGDNEKTLEHYTKAIEIDGNNFIFYNNRGNIHAQKHDYDKAIIDYKNAIKLNPNRVAAYSNIGHAYTMRGNKSDYDLAIIACSKAIQIKPDYAKAYNNRGNAYRRKAKYKNAVADYSEAIRLKLDYAVIYFNRGSAYMELKELDNALNDFNKAVELSPDFSGAHLKLGHINVKFGKHKEARGNLETALRLAKEQGKESFAIEVQKIIDKLSDIVSGSTSTSPTKPKSGKRK